MSANKTLLVFQRHAPFSVQKFACFIKVWIAYYYCAYDQESWLEASNTVRRQSNSLFDGGYLACFFVCVRGNLKHPKTFFFLPI